MSSASLPLLVDVQEGTRATSARIAVFGDLDHDSAYPLERAVIHVLREQRPAHLEIDLAGVPFLDTGGIKVLLRCRADARQLDCRLTVAHARPLVYRVLEIVGLLEPFAMAETAAP